MQRNSETQCRTCISFLTQRAKELEVFPQISVSHQLKAAPEEHELPRTPGLPMCRHSRHRRTKKSLKLKNHSCCQSDVRTMCIEMEGTNEKWVEHLRKMDSALTVFTPDG